MKRFMGGLRIIWKTWDTFWQETSISGLANAGKARFSNPRRFIWMLIFFAGAFGTVYSLLNVVWVYFLDSCLLFLTTIANIIYM